LQQIDRRIRNLCVPCQSKLVKVLIGQRFHLEVSSSRGQTKLHAVDEVWIESIHQSLRKSEPSLLPQISGTTYLI
jgi:hypothetical protein